jgi:hypothetical protein
VGVFPAPKGGCWRGCWSGLGARRGPCALRAVVFIHSQTTPSLISQALSRRVWLPPAARRTPMRSRRGAGGGVELGCSGSWGLNGARLRSVLPWLHVGATWGDVGDPSCDYHATTGRACATTGPLQQPIQCVETVWHRCAVLAAWQAGWGHSLPLCCRAILRMRVVGLSLVTRPAQR